jgi:hypothetical protein
MPQPEHYAMNEGARRTVLLVRASVRVLRGRSTAKLDKRLDRLDDEAIAREAKAKRTK